MNAAVMTAELAASVEQDLDVAFHGLDVSHVAAATLPASSPRLRGEDSKARLAVGEPLAALGEGDEHGDDGVRPPHPLPGLLPASGEKEDGRQASISFFTAADHADFHRATVAEHGDFHRKAAAEYATRRVEAKRGFRAAQAELRAERKRLKDAFDAAMRSLAEREFSAREAMQADVDQASLLEAGERAWLKAVEG